MKNKNYIPKNTHDVVAVERLKRLPFEAVKRDVPELLEWLQDMHWDVAPEIAEYLVPHVNEITDELLFILNTDDGMWKYHVINALIAQSQDKLHPALIKVLKRIVESPSKIEVDDTVDDAAKRVITNNELCD